MKKRTHPNNLSQKKANAAKRQKKKEEKKAQGKAPPQPPVQLSYKYMKVQKIVFRIGYISKDLATVGLDACLKYRHNVDAEFKDMMQDAVDRNTAGKDMAARVVERYATAPVTGDPAAPDEDDDGDDNDDDGDDSGNEAEDDDDDSEAMEEDNDPDGGEGRDKKRARAIQTVKFRLFTKASRLPVLNPYAGFICTLRGEPDTSPPSFDDLDIVSVANVYPRGGVAIYKVMRTMRKMGKWIGDPLQLSKDKLKIEKRRPGGMEPRFTKMEDLVNVLGTAEHRILALTLFRDVFRSADFYWMIGLVPRYRLSMLTDDMCATLHTDLLLGNILTHVFETATAPLDVDQIMPHIATRRDLRKAMDRLDTPLNVEPVASAARLWSRWWTRLGLYRGLYEWRLDDGDSVAAAEFLESRGHVVRVDDDVVVPTFILTHFKQLHMAMAIPKRVLEMGVLMGDVSMLIPAMAPLFGTMNVSTRRMVLCPTLQSVKHCARATGGLECYNMARGDRKEMAEVIAKHEVFVLADMHLFAAAQLRSALVEIASHAAALSTRKHRRCYIIFCGVNTAVIHAEMQGPNCMWSHFLASELRLALPSYPLSSSSASITSDTLDGCRNSMADKGLPRTVGIGPAKLMMFTLPPAAPEAAGGLLAPEDVESIASKIRPAVQSMLKYMNESVDTASTAMRPTLFLFENHTHMQQIVATPEFTGSFPHDVLVEGCWAVECDGGHRKVEKLWIRSGPVSFERRKTIRVPDMAPELIFYRLEGDHHTTQRCFETRPITPSFYATISHARFSPDPGLDILAIFTASRRKFRRTALNTLSYLATGNLVLMVLEKTTGTQIHEDERAFNVNLFDLATPPGREADL